MQTSITFSLSKSTEEAYRKLITCAYEMAMEPTMAHRHFKVLVKCVKANGVRLLEGKDDGKSGREFVQCIAQGTV